MADQKASFADDLATVKAGSFADDLSKVSAAPSRTWTDVATDMIPAAGGVIGGVVGGIGGTVLGMGVGGVPGAIGGAATGGAAGEAFKQLINRARGAEVPATSTDAAGAIGKEAVVDAAGAAAGVGLGKAAQLAVNATENAGGKVLLWGAKKILPGWAGDVLDLAHRLQSAGAPPQAVRAAVTQVAPRLAGKAPVLENVLTDILGELRQPAPLRISAEEAAQGLKWHADGVSWDEITKRIMDSKAFNAATGLK